MSKRKDPTLSLALKGFPVGIPRKEICLALIATGDVDTTVTVNCVRPDGYAHTFMVDVKPLTYGKIDVVPVVIPDSQVIAGGAGDYEIWATATVDTKSIESNHLIVSVKPEIETVKFGLKDPDGNPTERGRGAIILFHKKSGYFGVFGTDMLSCERQIRYLMRRFGLTREEAGSLSRHTSGICGKYS